MGKKRLKKDTNNSFYRHSLYEQLIPKDHSLLKLNQLIPGKAAPANWLYVADESEKTERE